MKTTLYLICLTIIFVSCKKEKKDPTLSGAINQNVSTDSINGEFSVRKNCNFVNDSLVAYEIKASAQFFQAKTFKYATTNPSNINVGTVKLNGVQFFVEPTYNFYVDTTNTIFMPPYTWQVSGNGSYPGLIFTDNINFPNYIYSNTLPDTIMMDQQSTINIGSYSGAWAKVIIQSSVQLLVKTIEFPTHQITLQANEMYNSGLGYEQGWISVEINNSDYKPVNGKMYRFNSTIAYLRPVVLKFP